MTIEVKNTPKQSIEILVKNATQEIDVVNLPEQKIEIAESASQKIDVENALEQQVGIKQDVIIVPVYKDAPEYEGEYEVTPKVTAQSLPTARKLMTKDVTIAEIPYAEVSNNSGGTTATIGNEV